MALFLEEPQEIKAAVSIARAVILSITDIPVIYTTLAPKINRF
jgi:hypothetical protein